jgi:imidazolonepropionase-like amidohydrolase
MHVHLTTEAPHGAEPVGGDMPVARSYFLPLLIGYGITGVRDMAGDLRVLRAWRKAIVAGEVIGPRIIATGYKIGQDQPVVPGAPPMVRDADAARRSVQALKGAGADFVKIDLANGDLAPAVAEESKRVGLPFVGHVPVGADVGTFSDLGMRSVEHQLGIPLSCSSEVDSLRTRFRELRRRPKLLRKLYAWFGLTNEEDRLRARMVETHDPARCAALADRFVRNGTWNSPTLHLLRSIGRMESAEDTAAARRYQPAALRRVGRLEPSATLRALRQQYYRLNLVITREFFRRGVGTLAGTDAPIDDAIPGLSLHEELELMVEAGLTPLEALRTATSAPAQFLGFADSLGTVAVGKRADLLILSADPSMDIRNTQRIETVILGGTLLRRPQLDAMLGGVESMIASW